MNEHSKIDVSKASATGIGTNPLCELGVTDAEYKNLCDFLSQNYLNLMEELYGEKAQAQEKADKFSIFDALIDAHTPADLLESSNPRTEQEILSASRDMVEKSFYTALSGYAPSTQKI